MHSREELGKTFSHFQVDASHSNISLATCRVSHRGAEAETTSRPAREGVS
jgi:hypothetical protein